MYEALKIKFPNLTPEETLELAIFINTHTGNEIQRVYAEVAEMLNRNK